MEKGKMQYRDGEENLCQKLAATCHIMPPLHPPLWYIWG